MRKLRKASENHQKGTYVGLWRSIISNCRRWKAVDPTMVVFLCGAPTDGYRELLYQPGNWLARGRFVQCRGCSMERGSLRWHCLLCVALSRVLFRDGLTVLSDSPISVAEESEGKFRIKKHRNYGAGEYDIDGLLYY